VNTVAAGAVRRRSASVADRVVAAIPLASIYLWLCIVYSIEAWKRVTPWLFTDELEFTQLSRSLADTGHPARRGVPHGLSSLYPVMIAPLWWIDDVASAYSGIKYLDVCVMTSVVIPTYFLARLVVARRWALFAAAGAGLAPALAYSSWIVEETLAYPYAALCFFLIAKALVVRRRGWIVAAALASLVAPLVRGELIVIPITLGFATVFALWASEWGRSRRSSWSWGDYIGFFALVVGAFVLISGYASHHYHEWYAVTTYYKHRIIVLGQWAAGALAIGLGVIPLVTGIAALFPVRGEPRSRELRMVRCVAAGGIISFALYTGMKAAYLSTVFATRVEERNLIYITPLLFVGSAVALERRRVNVVAFAGAAIYAFYLVVGTPFQMGVQLYSDALGLSILQQANRYYEWTPSTAQWVLIALLVVGVGAIGAAMWLRARPRLATGLCMGVAVGVLVWAGAGEISAAAGTVSISRQLEATLRHPFTWVDDVAHGKPTLYLAQGVADPNPEWELEFWNRSIVSVSSLDGTLGGPGPSGSPNITTNGMLYWTVDPEHVGRLYDYAVEDWPCVDFAGTLAERHLYRGGASHLREWRLIQLTKPNRLRAMCTGIYPDGWTNANDSAYYRFTHDKPGWLRIRVSRQSWPDSPVHVQIGSIASVHHQPVMGKVHQQLSFVAHTQETVVKWLRAPSSRFAVRVVVDDKFVPRDVDPRLSDPRTLGAQVDYRFFTKLPRYAKLSTGS